MTPIISLCAIQLRTLCAARFLATLCRFTTSAPGPGELSSFWGFMLSRQAPSLGRGRVEQRQQHQVLYQIRRPSLQNGKQTQHNLIRMNE